MLALLLFLLMAEPNLNDAQSLTDRGDYEASNLILQKFKPNKDNNAQYCYLMAVNHFATNQKEQAVKWAELVENQFGEPVPVRYQVMANLIKQETSQWEKDDLADISREMRISQDRLGVGKAGPKTQGIQDGIVKKLDKIIKDIEDQIKEEEQKAAAEAEQKRRAEAARLPMPDSRPGSDSGIGKVDEKKLRHLAQNWGKLPEKERAKAMQDIMINLPARYRQVIEDYSRALSKSENK